MKRIVCFSSDRGPLPFISQPLNIPTKGYGMMVFIFLLFIFTPFQGNAQQAQTIKNLGAHSYNGYYLHLDKYGTVRKSAKVYTGSRWKLIAQGNNQYLIQSAANHQFGGYYLHLDKYGNVRKSSKVYTGSYWRLIDQGNGQYLIQSAANHQFGGHYLHLDKYGNVRKSSKVYAGCYWRFQ